MYVPSYPERHIVPRRLVFLSSVFFCLIPCLLACKIKMEICGRLDWLPFKTAVAFARGLNVSASCRSTVSDESKAVAGLDCRLSILNTVF